MVGGRPVWCDVPVELRSLRAFVAVADAGSLSAAARRLHLSQPALSQTITALERELNVPLLVRTRSGVHPTDAGQTLVGEARAVLARHDQALRAMAAHTKDGGGTLRVGVPLELPADVLPSALERLATASPGTRVQARHLSTAAQVVALRAGELDAGLLRERPQGPEFDAMLVITENLGVLLAAAQATERIGPDGLRLEALCGLDWVGFPRSGSPAWFDEVAAILRSHGLGLGPDAPEDQALIADVKFAAVAAGTAFALAPPDWAQPIPESITWSPLAGNPLVRRTWIVWPADSRRRDLGHLVAAFEQRTLP